jgi:hypothetical protein
MWESIFLCHPDIHLQQFSQSFYVFNFFKNAEKSFTNSSNLKSGLFSNGSLQFMHPEVSFKNPKTQYRSLNMFSEQKVAIRKIEPLQKPDHLTTPKEAPAAFQ